MSTPLLNHLSCLLPQRPNYTLSIGSGSGLLEALLVHRHPNLCIQGVEVHSSVNRYLADEDVHVVGGTWDLLPPLPLPALLPSEQQQSGAGETGKIGISGPRACMFVYPREPALVGKYLDLYCVQNQKDKQQLEMVLWLGPRVDWPDYEAVFRGWFVNMEFEDVGLPEYEMLVVARIV
ncbi:uncharacterized protein ATNIH1004_008570 [Aspergillus tanneri]|uniref:Uncharacterized protein n=1 Tax=Aspergillus tanneri TaxID=1220188 RepID=A0A5M9MBR1_9EURO|nr:uncharacterized protein ATNIH1004_008570 [Aspergillus tanneri]KAA8644368.1 hypothetical protein ATNIH1004_008570 [Aspergillus tanneri]